MTTVAVMTPESAGFPASNFAPLTLVNRRMVLAYDAATDEAAQWSFVAPDDMTALTEADVFYMMASATSGSVDWEVSIEAVTPGDALDLDAADGWDSVNANHGTVPATAGYPGKVTVTLTNVDNIAAEDLCRVRVNRDANDATNDTASGDAYVLAVTLRE